MARRCSYQRGQGLGPQLPGGRAGSVETTSGPASAGPPDPTVAAGLPPLWAGVDDPRLDGASGSFAAPAFNVAGGWASITVAGATAGPEWSCPDQKLSGRAPLRGMLTTIATATKNPITSANLALVRTAVIRPKGSAMKAVTSGR